MMSSAPARNYTIMPQVNRAIGKLDMFLVKSDGTTNLRDLMIKMHGLLPNNYFGHNPKQKIIYYDQDRMKCKGFVLDLLHEIAHSHIYKSPPDLPKLKNLESLQKKIRSVKYYSAKKLLQRNQPNDFDLETDLERFFEINTSSPEVKSEQYQYLIQQERKAWELALKMARALEKKGFNVLGEFKDNNEIFEHITFCLASYEYIKRFGEVTTDSYTPLSRKLRFIR